MVGVQRIEDHSHLGDLAGETSLRSSNRFGPSSAFWVDKPVMLPPGRARLATRPVPTGSPITAGTIGMTEVACCAAATSAVPCVTMTSTGSRTNSAAISAMRALGRTVRVAERYPH
jgi:hypothetical protein